MRLAELADRRIAILGAGREGQAAYAWLRARMPHLALTLIAESPADPQFLESLESDDIVHVEPLTGDRLRTFDVLIRSPGISPYREPLRAASDAGVRITTPSNLWFAAHPGAQTIGVTGTKGKSTTSALLAHLLQSCGCRVQLAGNIGLPLLACGNPDVDWWVIELSSYQIADLVAAPTIAVILNLSPEHLDWHGSESTYRRDKLRLGILAEHGTLIANASDAELASHFSTTANVTWFNTSAGIHVVGRQILEKNTVLPVRMPAGLPGRHNLSNTAAALTAVKAAGHDVWQAGHAVESFSSLPHRLQVLGKRGGVTYVNDSIASNPLATVAALEAFRGRPIILILGGMDRGLDWSRYTPVFAEQPPRAVIGLPASGPRIAETLRQAGVSPAKGFHQTADLRSAVKLAKFLAEKGDTVLLSPGAPSFPQFIDFRERGQAFARFCGFNRFSE